MDAQHNIDEIIKKYRVQSEIKDKIINEQEINIDEIIDKYKIDFTNKDRILKEELLTEFDWELVLLGLGFIPVIGEVFDTILIIKYFKERRWLEAGLMMIALIPTVGDIAVKPFLIAGRGLKMFTNTGKFASVLEKFPKLAAQYKKLGNLFGSPGVSKLTAQITKKHPELAGAIAKSKQFHINAAGKYVARAKMTKGFTKGPLAKTILKSKPKKGLGFATQQHFRAKAYVKYANKHGKLPPTGLKGWYHLVYKGRKARRSAFRKAFIASNLLGVLGLPNIEAFQDYIATPEGAEDVMNRPEFQDLYNEVTTDQDEQYLDQQLSGESAPEASSFDTSAFSIPFFKKMAATYAA